MENHFNNCGLGTGYHTPQCLENRSKVKMETVLVLEWYLHLELNRAEDAVLGDFGGYSVTVHVHVLVTRAAVYRPSFQQLVSLGR
jgi:hypothetical protein